MKKEYDFNYPKTHVTLTDNYISLARGDNNLMIHKSMRGETQLFFKNILGVKFKKPSFTGKGYLEFTMPQTGLNGIARSVQQKNAIFFKKDQLNEALEIKAFVESRL